MRVLAMASQKGGSGKTTLSGHLAVQAQLAGAGPVVLIDIDPQGSLSDWWNARHDEYPAFAQTTVAPITIHHRTDFAASMIDGRTVMEVDPKGRSAAEVTELWSYIADRLEKNFRRTVFAAPTAVSSTFGMQRPSAGGGFGRRVMS